VRCSFIAIRSGEGEEKSESEKTFSSLRGSNGCDWSGIGGRLRYCPHPKLAKLTVGMKLHNNNTTSYLPTMTTLHLMLLFTLSAIVLPVANSFAPHRGSNRLFLDTAVESEWESLIPSGIFHGITTNPTLLERAGHKCTISSVQSLAKRALSLIGCDEFMCQAWGPTSEDMYNVGMLLSQVDRERVVVKVPVTMEGTKAASKLINAGVRICLTACYSSDQAIVAAGLGAQYLGKYSFVHLVFQKCNIMIASWHLIY